MTRKPDQSAAEAEAQAQNAWDEAIPTSKWRDKHGRPDIEMHPFILYGEKAQFRTTGKAPTPHTPADDRKQPSRRSSKQQRPGQ